MSPGIEGALHIRLTLADGRVDEVEVGSSRPLGAANLFVGKTVDQVLTMIPLLYGICATAQSAAAVQAAEQTLGQRADRSQQRARDILVLVETAREHLVRVLMGWSQWLGEPPPVEALRVVGRLKSTWSKALYPHSDDGFKPGGGTLTDDLARAQRLIGELSELIEQHVLGMAGMVWLDRQDNGDALLQWADIGTTSAARLLKKILEQGRAALGRSQIPVLAAIDPVELALRLGRRDAGEFIAAPTWCGAPRETGALAREHDTPLLRYLAEGYGNGLLTRQAARLSELAHLPGRLQAQLTAMSSELGHSDAIDEPRYVVGATDRWGLGIVEAARGVLAHRLDLDGDRIRDYRILAPTEWNFHPDGVLVHGLRGLDADEDLSGLVRLLVDAIDPCVGYQLEIVDSDRA